MLPKFGLYYKKRESIVKKEFDIMEDEYNQDYRRRLPYPKWLRHRVETETESEEMKIEKTLELA